MKINTELTNFLQDIDNKRSCRSLFSAKSAKFFFQQFLTFIITSYNYNYNQLCFSQTIPNLSYVYLVCINSILTLSISLSFSNIHDVNCSYFIEWRLNPGLEEDDAWSFLFVLSSDCSFFFRYLERNSSLDLDRIKYIFKQR